MNIVIGILGNASTRLRCHWQLHPLARGVGAILGPPPPLEGADISSSTTHPSSLIVSPCLALIIRAVFEPRSVDKTRPRRSRLTYYNLVYYKVIQQVRAFSSFDENMDDLRSRASCREGLVCIVT